MNTTPIYTLGALLRDRAARRPDEPALVFPDSRTSYADLNGRARRWAALTPRPASMSW